MPATFDPPVHSPSTGVPPSVMLTLLSVVADVLVDNADVVDGDNDLRLAATTLAEEIRQLLRPGARGIAERHAREVRRLADRRRLQA